LAPADVAITFWDIRGFSLLCTQLEAHPGAIGGLVREFSDLVAASVRAHGGVLDKFIGDGAMAIFGWSPKAQAHGVRGEAGPGALHAVRCAAEVRTGFEALRQRVLPEMSSLSAQALDFGVRCGIHAGRVLMGNVGCSVREQFTALGPGVNLAARLESRAEDGEILVSNPVRIAVEREFELVARSVLTDIKNMPGPYPTYAVVGPRSYS